ncbi:hypothetical protein DSCO28_36470 [Desulfosarcina ovata subsp. sediminis]|uniref:Uncharacterized protein n=1 Tax=Desulfosarcina ovata subsp. sediminis TaxID=885957 RepID=A0A5K7ZSA0_9BACT|nr:hypothetical protein DSCO28_36470 [Desulfosarcina ovata subsp. sediminis]
MTPVNTESCHRMAVIELMNNGKEEAYEKFDVCFDYFDFCFRQFWMLGSWQYGYDKRRST